MAEDTRRVQLTLPECSRLAEMLFDEIREELGLPEHIDDQAVKIDAEKWGAVLPKLQRAIKLAPGVLTSKPKKGAGKTE